MEDVVKKALILFSIITGLLFTASLCYSLVIGYSGQVGNNQGTASNVSATDTNIETTEVAVGKTVTRSIATETPNQIATNAPTMEIASEGLTWNGLKIEVANVNYDAWPLIKAQNHLNDPPLEGMTMLLVTIRVTNVEGATDEAVKLSDSNFQTD